MSTLLLFLTQNPTIIGIFAAVVGAIGWGFTQRLAGAKAERNKRAVADAAAHSEAQKIDDAVAGRDPGDNRERLSGWSKQ